MTTPSAPDASTEPRPGSVPALEPGDVLAERYRLVQVVSDDHGPAVLWRANDEVLARAVAVKVLPAGGRAGVAAATPFLAAAGRASGLSHPGLARVYDAALEERPALRAGRTVDVAYVISEWVEGRTLAELLLTDGPLDPADAVRLTLQVAEALRAAHARGVGHGRIHPGNVLVTPAGRVRVTDAAVAAAAHGEPVPPAGPDGSADPDTVRADTRDLGAVLYAMLTARWPAGSTDQPAGGLSDAPRASAAATAYAPRQVRAGVPRALDAVVVRTLEPGRQPSLAPIDSPMALVRALDEVDLKATGGDRAASGVAPRTRRRRRPPPWVPRALPKVLALAFIVGIGLVGYRVGQDVGELPRRPGALDALVASTPSPEPGVAAGSRLDLSKPPITVKDYDPFSRDGVEQSDKVPNAYDGDPSTVWSTDGYRTAAFSGLKPGVGLLVDLGNPARLSAVQVGMTAAGADIDLRAANTLGANADDFTVVARSPDSKQVARLAPSAPTPSRYWLVWFTGLPKADDGKFRLGVAELVFTRAG